jgi:hypothetical protein
LDLCLLVDAQHDRIRRGREVQADNIVDLRFGIRVGRELERLRAVRLERVCAPQSMHRGRRDISPRGHLAGAPLAQALRRLLQRERDDAGARGVGQLRRPARARAIGQPLHPIGGEAGTNPTYLHRRVPRPRRDFSAEHPIRHQQHRAGAATEAAGCRGRTHQSLEGLPIFVHHRDRAALVCHLSLLPRDGNNILS